jgi:hypothetical protein
VREPKAAAAGGVRGVQIEASGSIVVVSRCRTLKAAVWVGLIDRAPPALSP